MKTPKSKTKPAKTPAHIELQTEKVNEDFHRRIGSGRYYRWGLKERKPSDKLPTAEQLATLAATLGRTSQENHEKLCSSALNLWFTSLEAIDLQKQCNEDYQQLAAETEAWNKRLPQPKDSELPMTLDDFLKRLSPKQDTGERAEIFKQWLSQILYVERYRAARDAGIDLSSLGKPTKQDVTEKYTEARKELIDKQRFNYLCDTILGWYMGFRSEQTSNVRRRVRLKAIAIAKAIAKAAVEKKLKKSFEPLVTVKTRHLFPPPCVLLGGFYFLFPSRFGLLS